MILVDHLISETDEPELNGLLFPMATMKDLNGKMANGCI